MTSSRLSVADVAGVVPRIAVRAVLATFLRALATHRDAQLSRMPRALPLEGSTQHARFDAITLAIAMLSCDVTPQPAVGVTPPT